MIPSLTDTSLASDIELRQLWNSWLSTFALVIGHYLFHRMVEVVVEAVWWVDVFEASDRCSIHSILYALHLQLFITEQVMMILIGRSLNLIPAIHEQLLLHVVHVWVGVVAHFSRPVERLVLLAILLMQLLINYLILSLILLKIFALFLSRRHLYLLFWLFSVDVLQLDSISDGFPTSLIALNLLAHQVISPVTPHYSLGLPLEVLGALWKLAYVLSSLSYVLLHIKFNHSLASFAHNRHLLSLNFILSAAKAHISLFIYEFILEIWLSTARYCNFCILIGEIGVGSWVYGVVLPCVVLFVEFVWAYPLWVQIDVRWFLGGEEHCVLLVWAMVLIVQRMLLRLPVVQVGVVIIGIFLGVEFVCQYFLLAHYECILLAEISRWRFISGQLLQRRTVLIWIYIGFLRHFRQFNVWWIQFILLNRN